MDVFSTLKANKDKLDALLKDTTLILQRDAHSMFMSSDGRYHTIQFSQSLSQRQGTPLPLPPASNTCTYKISLT
jgi:hypothetical protein